MTLTGNCRASNVSVKKQETLKLHKWIKHSIQETRKREKNKPKES